MKTVGQLYTGRNKHRKKNTHTKAPLAKKKKRIDRALYMGNIEIARMLLTREEIDLSIKVNTCKKKTPLVCVWQW